MPRTLLAAASVLALGLGAASAQTAFPDLQNPQVAPATTQPGALTTPETGLKFEIGKPTLLELSRPDRHSPVEQTQPFFRSSVLSGHRIRNNGTTGIDLFDKLFN